MVRFDAILPIDNYKTLYELDELDWKNWIAATFLLIPNSNDVSKVEGVLAKYIPIQNKAREDWKIVRFEVQSLRQYTKESRDVWANWLWVNLHPAQRLAPAIMAILILLLACFNFMNTSISVANTRVKEIGIRKVVGSRKTHLIVQFIGENTLICLMALIVSILFAFFLLDEYNSMWSYMVLKMSFTGDIGFWIFLFILLIFTSIAAGAYPAFYLSSFNPVEVLRGVFRFKGAGKFSQVLLGFQMVISLVALISSIIFTQNAEYQDKFDMGYNVDGIIVVPLASGANYEALKSACISNPDIIDISGTSMHIGWGSYPRTIEFQGKKMETRVLDINSGYLNTMGLKLLEGRSFEPEFEESDPFKSVVVSELFVQELGITDPLNKIIRLDSLELIIVGVSKNYYNSLWDKLYPTIFISRGKDTRSVMVVRTHAEKEKEVKEFLKGEWEKLVPNSPFFGREQTEILREAKDVNKNIKNINLFLAFTAIVLSLIALYTLVSLNIIKRTKEIGVRIVMGSKGMGIVWLISRPFLIILAISSVLGGLGGYYLNSMLLKSLWVFHTPINMASITIPVLILFGVSFAIISVRVYILLLRNPIESLRYE
jgi:ABC-type antimicrobial peptide transport system permease subunit